MALFLSREQVYKMLQRELPPFVYPDGPPSAFYSTADNDAIADVAATGYANLERIYENYWPQTSDERIADWEITAFGRPLDSALTLAQRRDRIVTKLRSRKGLTRQDMIDVVQAVIGSDKLVDIQEWGCSDGGWMISESELSIETILNGARQVDATDPFMCEKTAADFGKTPEEWAVMQEEAYTYQVNIYGYTMTPAEAVEVEAALSETEPARSQHLVYDGLDPADMIGGDT